MRGRFATSGIGRCGAWALGVAGPDRQPGRFEVADGKRAAVVSGGASGIGLEIVSHLVAEGMRGIAGGAHEAACVDARLSLAASADRVRVIVADIGNPEGA